MEGSEKTARKKKAPNIVTSRVKNSDLVLKKHMHIAKKASKLFLKRAITEPVCVTYRMLPVWLWEILYNYIKQKEDVLCLVFDVFHRSLREYLEKKRVYDIEDPQEQLKVFVCRLLENAENFRDEIVFMYRESWLLPKAFKEKFMQKGAG